MTDRGAPQLDEAVLDDLRASVQGDRTFVAELIDAYVAEGAAHIDAIHAAIEAGDAGALVRPAHTLKSSSATLGATHLSATARELEMMGRSGSLGDRASELAASLRSGWPATSAALRAWVDRADRE